MSDYVFGDTFNISGRVKDIDPALFIEYDQANRKYHVKRTKRNGQAHHIMSVDKLDARILTTLRKGDLQRRSLEEFIRELEHSEDEQERQKAKELSNTIESMTLEQFDRIVGIPHYSVGHWRDKNDTGNLMVCNG